MDREKLVLAYMKEYEMSREAAEKRADSVIATISQIDSSEPDATLEDNDLEMWDISELMCCKCFERWIAVRPSSTMLKDIECPRCKFTGAAVETGQEFYIESSDEDYLEDDDPEDNNENS